VRSVARLEHAFVRLLLFPVYWPYISPHIWCIVMWQDPHTPPEEPALPSGMFTAAYMLTSMQMSPHQPVPKRLPPTELSHPIYHLLDLCFLCFLLLRSPPLCLLRCLRWRFCLLLCLWRLSARSRAGGAGSMRVESCPNRASTSLTSAAV
jgi:hypothetical protein